MLEPSPRGVGFARTELNGQDSQGLFKSDIRDIETVAGTFGAGDDASALVGDIAHCVDRERGGGARNDFLAPFDGDGFVDVGEGVDTLPFNETACGALALM